MKIKKGLVYTQSHTKRLHTVVYLFVGAALQYINSGMNIILTVDIPKSIACPVLFGLGHLSLVATAVPR